MHRPVAFMLAAMMVGAGSSATLVEREPGRPSSDSRPTLPHGGMNAEQLARFSRKRARRKRR